ncbi:MAG: LytS/YhcK type 5TM receptor domain-containing protein [Pseudomonadota bacterium]
MDMQFEAVVSVLAALALILQATFLVESARGWGISRGLSDLPAGLLLGAISVAQMFHPIEPFDGVIVDLRLVPLFLASAFLSLPAMILAITLAVTMRLGIGGIGMVAGVAGILSTGLLGQGWQRLRHKLPLSRTGHLIVLGQLATLSLISALVLAEPVRSWFLTYAAPHLALIYITLVPLLGYVLDERIGFANENERSAREALRAEGVRRVSVPAFLRRMRLAAMDDPENAPVALLTVRPRVDHMELNEAKMRDVAEVFVTRLHSAFPEFSVTAIRADQSVLMPITAAQLDRLGATAQVAHSAVTERPVSIKPLGLCRVAADVGLVHLPSCTEDETGPVVSLRRARDVPAGNMYSVPDLLFAKAEIKLDQS